MQIHRVGGGLDELTLAQKVWKRAADTPVGSCVLNGSPNVTAATTEELLPALLSLVAAL